MRRRVAERFAAPVLVGTSSQVSEDLGQAARSIQVGNKRDGAGEIFSLTSTDAAGETILVFAVSVMAEWRVVLICLRGALRFTDGEIICKKYLFSKNT